MLIREIVEASQGTLFCGDLDAEVEGFTQDTRKIVPGNVYVAIKGLYLDGHDFIPMAFAQGAKAVLCERVPDYIEPQGNMIVVDNTVMALGRIARYVRLKSNAIVIGITGSVGKTSTKDMIYSVVSMKYKTLKTMGNYNNFIGLPLTILRYKDEEAMVIEMGMNHLNEIDHLTKVACPDIAAITNVGTAHIGELGSRENILQAKMEIINGLREGGTLVVNCDNDKLATVKAGDGYQLKKISINAPSDLKANNVILNEDMSSFTVNVGGKDYWVRVYVPGKHFVYNALVAIQIGLLLGISIEDCIEGVAHFELTEKRSDIIMLQNNIRVIDGTYNANLDSMKSSIDVIAQYQGRRIAVLADMLELGSYSERLHREVGAYLIKQKIDIVLTVGEAAWYIFDEVVKSKGKARHFNSNKELIDYLNSMIYDGDVILIKGSNGMHLKDVVLALKEAN
ncbi:MAG: UDP-N-acetylmuramoyl-tripeptide--D-alanyl-D-alanine ligase [Erysipelotrichaceae bacterium]|nr:UDP-N-acetylmuramoyl-tripeptide--D-alanyl-D-alanine ligase [Erysipelotrichaceae bacterium]